MDKKVQHYTLGFVFNENKSEIALIAKARPSWQKGKLNAIGGKVENGEALEDAQCREFFEETGLLIPSYKWSYFAVMDGGDSNEDWHVHCFTTVTPYIEECKTQPPYDEAIWIVDVYKATNPNGFGLNILENVPWMIQLALDHLNDGRPNFVVVNYPTN